MVLKMTSLIYHIVKSKIQMGLHNKPIEVVTNIACIGEEIHRIERKKIPQLFNTKLL